MNFPGGFSPQKKRFNPTSQDSQAKYLTHELQHTGDIQYHHTRPIAAYTKLNYTLKQINPLLGYQPSLRYFGATEHYGKRIELSTIETGDIIGRNIAAIGVTICIPDPQISKQHIFLKRSERNTYIVRDLGSEEGSWIALTMSNPNEVVINTHYKIGDYFFRFLQGPPLNELEEFLDLMDLVYLTDDLYANNIQNLAQLLDLDQDTFEKLPCSLEEKKKLYEELKKLAGSLAKDYQKHCMTMMIILSDQKEHFVEFGLKGIKVGYSTSCDYRLQKVNEKDKDVEFTVKYISGKYYIIPQGQEILKRLDKNEDFLLKPGLILQLGTSKLQYNLLDIYTKTSPGNRSKNEDGSIIRQDLNVSDYLNCSLFCIINGQGGDECTKFLEANFMHYLIKNIGIHIDDSQNVFEDLRQALKRTFMDLDMAFYSQNPQLALTCGATMCGILLLGEALICFNLGESRAVVVKESSFIRLSTDHLPGRPDEKERIQKIGGIVKDGRLNGKMDISRCFGQFEYKETMQHRQLKLYNDPGNAQLLSCDPEITVYFINQQEDDLILLYTSRLYESFQEERMFGYIQHQARTDDPKDIELGLDVIVKEGTKLNPVCDNMTVLLIKIPKP